MRGLGVFVKVLIVDDVQMARENMKCILEREGIEVIEADNGEKALQLFKEENPDVVSLDIDMPKVDGIEVLKQIKNIKEDVNIIMVSVMSSQYHHVESFKNGAKYFLSKPIDLIRFVEVVKSFEKTAV